VDGLAAVLLLTAVTVVSCLGDSITEGSPHWNARRREGDEEGQWEHWAGLRHPELAFRNHGVWGERTDEILARFDEAADGADALIVQGGINDIAQGRPVDAAAANLAHMVERALALDLRVAVCDVLPWNAGWPDHAAAIRALNERIHAFGVPVLPFHDTLEDPERPGRMAAEWADPDGTTRYISPIVTDVLGYEPEELIGTPYGDLLEPSDRAVVRAYWEQRLDGVEVPPPSARVRRKDGTWATLEGVISILRDAGGEPSGYLSVSRAVHRAALRPAAR
jgi:PAS domain S-box-containing protein